jgi:outer membrane protein assembly factor BamA
MRPPVHPTGQTALAGIAMVMLVCLTAIPARAAAQDTLPEVIAEIRVHGNHVTGDEELVALAGVSIGDPFELTTLEAVADRLKKTGRFVDVEVLKRYASIADSSRISLVIIVNEGAVRLEMPDPDDPDGEPRVVRRGFAGNLMWLPILSFEDGYGFTYGARVSYAGLSGDRSRLSFPLTWGGRRQAAADFSHTFTGGPVSRVAAGAGIDRTENPAYELGDLRRRAWGRVESIAGPLRAGGSVGWQRVSFGDDRDDIRSVGADVTFDTRLNPAMPRNAVLASASWERLDIASGQVLHQVRLDGQGFIGLWGQSVLALRARREDFNRPAPLYLRALLGGGGSLRGFRTGSFTGDTMVAGSAELLLPVSSPLRAGQLGVSAFVDTGTAYDKGERLADQSWKVGYGGSVWVTLTAFRMSLAVAHGQGASTRVHFSAGISF